MAGLLPKFTAAQCKQLQELGVLPQQVEKLRFAVALTRLELRGSAAKNDVAELLNEVGKLTDQLARRLRALWSQRDAAHVAAHLHIEIAYWPKRKDDDGPTVGHHLCPRLDALGDAAREAAASLPAGPTRHRTASARPIEHIDKALREGWRSAHGSGVAAYGSPVNTPPAFPIRMKPSASEKMTFRQICGVCYEAAGCDVDVDPLRAIKTYVQQCGKERRASIRGIEKAVESSVPKGKNRTSLKT